MTKAEAKASCSTQSADSKCEVLDCTESGTKTTGSTCCDVTLGPGDDMPEEMRKQFEEVMADREGDQVPPGVLANGVKVVAEKNGEDEIRIVGQSSEDEKELRRALEKEDGAVQIVEVVDDE